ncbi:putative O-methyltransferase [Aequorivita sublithincola DSM 14238]|uniref:Putative O-methyltransferase n=1 Tax=Aequorivita sublithincola (strain DSM 14238 / LMG 21431 / ACAM 643 / 9-3) TaxID=746697 RepID=I3YSM2_AEQSU|nr:O-methyltransferase [Aequorivita sublithincola]AFL79990.1 putative O-methyltransferase [Aequorivita sublithincola DSM 14238]
MDFLPEKLNDYVEKNSQPEPELLQKLNRETWQKMIAPRMLSGHLQGRVLSMLSKLIQPKNILEIGTYTGYSALCLAEGMQENSELHTIDINEELFDFQRKYFDESPFGKQIFQHLGNALEIIPKLEKTFDLVFIDADKSNYPNYLEIILPKLKKGSVILSDNVLWSGKVVEKLKEDDLDTKALLKYNEALNNHPKLETVLLPIRDGLTISRVR